MNPFSRYIDCLNCGNELTHLSKLVLNTPTELECDFCGQKYPVLLKRIKTFKSFTGLIFLVVAAILFWIVFKTTGFMPALFLLFPLFIVYYFTLALIINRIVRF